MGWRKMYGTPPAGNNAKPQPEKDQHAVRIALLWGRFKEEVQSGHAPPHMPRPNADYVMERRRESAAAAVAALTAQSKRQLKQKEIKNKARAEALVACVGRLAA